MSENDASPSASQSVSARFRRAALRGSVWSVVGHGGTQALRFVGNLVLARFLLPDAFGLATLVNVFNYGLIMLSDMGTHQCAIQSERGDEPEFLNTVWTLNILRGLVLWPLASLCAWPFAILFDAPELYYLIPVGSLSLVLGGFTSTSLIRMRRDLKVGTLTAIDLSCSLFSIAIMIVWVSVSPSVWALMAGSLANPSLRLVLSFAIPGHPRNRFAWDRAAAREVYDFGKWIFLSSAVFFLSRQTDRPLVGYFFGKTTLGVYSVALVLGQGASDLVIQLVNSVFYPIFGKVRDEGVPALRSYYYATRLRLDAIAMPCLGVLAGAGRWCVDLLYPDRYAQAGWMLEVLSIRIAIGCILAPCEMCLFAVKQTRYGLYQNLARTAAMAIGIPVGWHVAGIEGLVWAVALSEIPAFVMLMIAFARHKLVLWHREALAVALFLGGFALGAAVYPWLPS